MTTQLHHQFWGWGPNDRLVQWTSLTEPLRSWAEATPAAPFLESLEPPEMLTYADAWTAVRSTAAVLRESWAIRRGSRVAVVTSNSLDCVITILAAIHLGARCILVNPSMPSERRADQIVAARPDLVVCGDLAAASGGPGVPAVNVVTVADVVVRTGLAAAALDVADQADPDAAAFIFYTTGSTAVSKRVVQNSYSVLVNITALARHLDLRSGRRLIGVLPVCFANGLQLSVLAPMISGATCILLPEFHPMTYLSDVARSRAEVASLVPSMLDVVSRARAPELPDLGLFVTAAAPLQRTTAERTWYALRKRVIQGYGLSETTNFSTIMPTDLSDADYARLVLGSKTPPVGPALMGCEVAILDERDRAVPLGTVGEVCMRGHSVALGYEDNPEETARAFRGGWFHSGDLGRLDLPDGWVRPVLTLTGRLKNIAKIGGVAVSLEEIERVISQLGGVLDVMCVAERHPQLGEGIRIDVHTGGGDVDVDEVRRSVGTVFCLSASALRVRLVPSIPRSPNGKVMRPGVWGGERADD